MPTTKGDARVIEFWGGPRDGERTTLEEFLERYPKKIASFPLEGSALLHVYKADLDSERARVCYVGELTADEAAALSDDNSQKS